MTTAKMAVLALCMAGCTDGCGGGSTPVGLTRIDGPADAPVNDHIPDLDFVIDPDDYELFLDQVSFSKRNLLVGFAGGVTVAQANELIAERHARIMGGSPAATFLLIRFPTADADELGALAEQLAADPRIELAIPDMGGGLLQLPPASFEAGFWEWDPETPAVANWGLERIRAPFLWNLDTAVRRRGPFEMVVATYDGEGEIELSHSDLDYEMLGGKGVDPHALQVAGIIGARWDNGNGVVGVSPWLKKLYVMPGPAVIPSFGDELDRIADVVKNRGAKVVNVSMGVGIFYKCFGIDPEVDLWGDLNRKNGIEKRVSCTIAGRPGTSDEHAPVDVDRDGRPDTWSDRMNQLGAMYRDRLGGSDALFVAAAGNFGDPVRNESPIANATRFGSPFVSVGAIDILGAQAYNGEGASVHAPGVCVGTTNDSSGVTTRCQASSQGQYIAVSGTSVAAPFVAGTLAALWTVQPLLHRDEVRALVLDPRNQHPGMVPSLDARLAMLAIDDFISGFFIHKALVDVDDGTEDGNQRTDPSSLTGLFDDVPTSDGWRGDGHIDMSDLRAYRDAVARFWLENLRPGAILDGGAHHFKLDFNFDGCIDGKAVDPFYPFDRGPQRGNCTGSPLESVQSRYDFNGDGSMNPTLASAPGVLRDIDYLADPRWWELTEERVSVLPSDEGLDTDDNQAGWVPRHDLLRDRDGDGLIDYLESFDLQIVLETSDEMVINLLENIGGPLQRACYNQDGYYGQLVKCRYFRAGSQPAGRRMVVTLPIFGQRVDVAWQVGGAASQQQHFEYFRVHPGEDCTLWLPSGVTTCTRL